MGRLTVTDMQRFEQLLNELEASRLEVQLAPLNPRLRNYNEGGMKRVVVSVPPTWYRKLCREYPSSRGIRRGKFDTRIRRANVLSTLRVLSEGRTTPSKYVPDLGRIAATIK